MLKLSTFVLATACASGLAHAQAHRPVTDTGNGVARYAEGESRFPFSMAVRAGDTLYISGQIGAGSTGLAKGFEAQSRQAMDNVFSVLKYTGLNAEDLVKCTIMIGDMAKWPVFNEVYKSYFKPGHYPARSAFGANGLALGAELEVDCIAYMPAKK
jgi:2-iminobutanoate/2-iminopropanoate deaminase